MGKPKKGNSQWTEVKLSGNLLTDDSIGMLDGLIGLEVMENYDKNIVQKQKRPKRPKAPVLPKKTFKGQDSDQDDDDDEGPAKKKKKKQKQKKTEESTPGRFVMAPPADGSDQDDQDEDQAPPVDEDDYSSCLPEWQYYNLQDCFLKAIKENGFKTPTEIQKLTLAPAILGRRDILGAAETGSGKTLAFGLPILNGILHLKKQLANNDTCSIRKGIKPVVTTDEEFEGEEDLSMDDDEEITGESAPLFAVVLTPTRELAVQVKDHIKSVAKYSGIQVAAIFGGMAVVKQRRVLKSCPEIVVATPGRLWELLKEGDPHLNKIDDISFLAIDETDRMVEKGHFEELKLLMERLNRDESKKSKRQNFIFSATLTLVHDIPDYLKLKNVSRRKKFQGVSAEEKLKQFIQGLGISQPKIVDITKKSGTAEKLTECRIVCDLNEKDFYLYYFLQQHPGRTIVFCNSIDCVRRLANLFSLLGCQPLPLHANMIQKQRLKNLERFRDNVDALLIATDVAARGLDIPKVDHVIHYQVPRTSENYVHRSGRTARANTEGITVMLMEPGEMKYYNKICKTLGRSDDLPIFPVSLRHLQAVKDRVNLAREVDVLELRATKESKEIGWLEKAAEEADIMLDEFEGHNEFFEDHDGGRGSRKGEVAETQKLVKEKKKELAKLLQQSIFPKGFSFKYPTSSGALAMPVMGLQNKENAVSVMKDALEKDREGKANSVLKGEHLKNYRGKKPKKAVKGKKGKSGKENAASKAANGMDKPKTPGKDNVNKLGKKNKPQFKKKVGKE